MPPPPQQAAPPAPLADAHAQTGSHAGSLEGIGEAMGATAAGSGQGMAARGGVQSLSTSRGAAPVRLPVREWHCPWPAQAEYEDIDQQLVSIRVLVAADGRVERAELVSDPGFGFGAAARECARRVRFTPALDSQGRATRALSPPIHVRFVR